MGKKKSKVGGLGVCGGAGAGHNMDQGAQWWPLWKVTFEQRLEGNERTC